MRIITTNSLFALASAALAVGTVLLAVPASAATADTLTRQIDVHYGDLDLTSAAARATLHHRISAAAYNVCKTDSDTLAQAASATCREQAVADATRRMDTVIAAASSSQRVAWR